MLQSIRERAQGVVAWFIVILISIPFALFGINSYLGGGSESIAATVNGEEITQNEFENSYRDFRQSLRQRMGANYRPELIDEQALRKEVLDMIIRNRLLSQKTEELDLQVGDALVRELIVSIPAFQVGGQFNQDAYERGVRVQGLTTSGFEEQMRRGLVNEQLSKAVITSAFTTRSELERMVSLRLQQREFSHLLIPAGRFLEEVEVEDASVEAYYNENQDAFMAPERVKVEYLDLDVDTIAATLQVDEEALQAYYNQNQSQYMSPEQRRASHILIPVEEDAASDEVEQARSEARQALQRIRDGESFADVAKAVSQDPGSADLGGDLGFFEPGIMDPAFDEAVFALNEGELSEPVRTPFGFHIIQLTEIRAPEGESLEEAYDDVKQAYLKNEASRLFYEYAEQLSNIAYEEPGSLQPAAEALGIKPKVSEWITRDGGDGIFAAPKVVSAAFSEDVMIAGNNSEAIELDAEHILVLRVLDHEETAIKPFDSVAQEIRDRLRVQKALEKAREQGVAWVSQLQQGGTLSALAEELGLETAPTRKIGRDTQELPPELVRHVFAVSRPTEKDASFDFVPLQSGDLALIELTAVIDGEMSAANDIGGEAALTDAMSRSRGQNYFQHLQANLRTKSDIEIRSQTDE